MGSVTARDKFMHDYEAAVLDATSVEDAVHSIRDLSKVDHATYHILHRTESCTGQPYVRTTYPPEWVSYYLQHNLLAHDPVVHHARDAMRSFNWDALAPEAHEMKMIQDAGRFGIGQYGFTFIYADPTFGRAMLSLNDRRPVADWDAFEERTKAALEDLLKDLHIKALGEAMADREDQAKLAPRELECLFYNANGKSYSEIAIILSLSEHTVRSYLRMARIKLDCVTLTQAVAKAIRAGIL